MTGNAIREALEPCPFCGGAEPKLHTNLAAAMSWVSCAACGLEAPTETGVTDEQAVAYWNRRDRTGAGGKAAWKALGEAMSQGDYSRSAFERIEAALRPCLSPVSVEEVDASHTPCERCQGNGEIVTDWDRYRHPRKGDVGDEAVAECPDCSGEGTHTANAGAGLVSETVLEAAWQAFGDCPVDMCGDHDTEQRKCVDAAVVAAFAARPVEEPGEVERLTRERDEARAERDRALYFFHHRDFRDVGLPHPNDGIRHCTGINLDRLAAAKRLRDVGLVTIEDSPSGPMVAWASGRGAALTGDAQEGGR